MKKVLVLTDLSDKAAHAAEVALKIAERLKANLILFNAFPVVEAFPVTGVGMWPIDDFAAHENDSKYGLSLLAENLKKLSGANGFHPQITFRNAMGNFGSVVGDLLKEAEPDLIVMGGKGADKLGHFFIGSESNMVLRIANCPVLFIPETYSYMNISKIVFADDLERVRPSSVHFLTDLARSYNAEIILTHITNSEDEAKLGFKGCINTITKNYNYPNATNKCIIGKDIKTTLLEIPDLLQADLFVMIHHRLSFLNRLFAGSMTKHVLKRKQVPLLVLPG